MMKRVAVEKMKMVTVAMTTTGDALEAVDSVWDSELMLDILMANKSLE